MQEIVQMENSALRKAGSAGSITNTTLLECATLSLGVRQQQTILAQSDARTCEMSHAIWAQKKSAGTE